MNQSTDQASPQGIPSSNTSQQPSQFSGSVRSIQQQQQTSSLDSGAGLSSLSPPQAFGLNLQTTSSVPAPSSTTNSFDLSSYDPLQAHALQLTVSAGLAQPSQEIATAAPGIGTLPTVSTTAQATTSEGSTSHQTQPNLPQQYYYVQNPTTNALQVILAAPVSAGQPPPHAFVGQAPATLPQKYITTGATNAPIPVPNNFGDPSFLSPAIMQAVISQQFAAAGVGAAGQAPLLPAPQSSVERVTAGAAAALARASRETNNVTPSVVSSSTSGTNANALFSYPLPHSSHNNNNNMGSTSGNRKKPPPAPEPGDDFPDLPPNATEEEKRRHERNMREQQRSLKISQQIQQLRDLLTDSGIPFKPNKFSILYSVADYIKQLQARAIMLDAEHRKLVETIRETTEMANSGDAQTSSGNDSVDEKKGSSIGNESELLFVQGLDYRAVFTQCPAALGVASLDGRILACNDEFQTVLGASREELLKVSLFNLMQNHQDVFRAMGEMLKSTGVQGNSVPSELPQMYWSGKILSQRNQNVSFCRLVLK